MLEKQLGLRIGGAQLVTRLLCSPVFVVRRRL
jgi:hypothetical protein